MPDDPRPIPATPESLRKTLSRRPVLWVGAGTSIAAGHPTTGALVDALIADADDPIDSNLPFEQAADAFVASQGPGALEDLLQRLVGTSRPLTDLHRALARQAAGGAFAAVVTTNYDDLLERALAEAEAATPSWYSERIAGWRCPGSCCASTAASRSRTTPSTGCARPWSRSSRVSTNPRAAVDRGHGPAGPWVKRRAYQRPRSRWDRRLPAGSWAKRSAYQPPRSCWERRLLAGPWASAHVWKLRGSIGTMQPMGCYLTE